MNLRLSSPIRRLMIMSVPVLLTACSDDNPLLDSREKQVKFDVTVMDSNSRATTRTAESSCRTLSLAEGEIPLYLHPKILNGIVTGKEQNGSTRSQLYSNENLDGFGVYAALVSGPDASESDLVYNYMNNVKVSRDNSWTPEESYLWPGTGSLHFNAYAPYRDVPDAEGITSLPSKNSSGNLSLSFSTPADVNDQFDLLVSDPTVASSSPCDLVFSHALTAIRFAAGAQMVPCSVKSITLSGVKSSANLDLETGSWSDLDNSLSFTVAPEVTLVAENGSMYVKPDTDITSGDLTFILLPQTLGDDAALSITFDINGAETKLDTSLSGIVWKAGTTVIYRLSVSPKEDSYILELTDSDGAPISQLSSEYTGSLLDFKVVSAFGMKDDPSSFKNIAWKAEFVDDAGNVIPRPDWITSWVMTCDGSTDVSSTTQMQVPVFESISEETALLRNAGDINVSSGANPYNLSNPAGTQEVRNTANCYLVHAPGSYSIPLVYGNAIADGATNTSSYQATTSSHTQILRNFINHLGAAITDPYIYNNANCNPADAAVIWEGRLNVVQNVRLSSDKKSLIFDVSPDFICQGNAVVAVMDAQGVVMWSWHLWITPYEPDANPISISYRNKNYEMMSQNLGQITSGDRANFAPQSAKVRYTQIPDDGSEPISLTIEVKQSGKIVSTPDSYNYYQWGRKDPMVSDVSEWYMADFREMTDILTKSFTADNTSGLPVIADYIRTPGYFWINPNEDESFQYYNLWNTNNSSTEEVKTIYDPSPVGYMVARNVLMALNNAPSVGLTGKYGVGLNVTVPGTSKVAFFPAHGYRARGSGQIQGTSDGSEIGTVWSSRTTSTKEASALVLQVKASTAQLKGGESRGHAFGVRASKQL